MAEAIWREQGWQAFSAGSAPAGYVHPLAVRAMQEVGIDISGQASKHLDSFQNDAFDLVLTVCDRARETCPILPHAAETLHWSIVDPAHAGGDQERRLHAFRACRQELWDRIENYAARYARRPN